MLTNTICTKSAYYPYPTDFCKILLFLNKSLNKDNRVSDKNLLYTENGRTSHLQLCKHDFEF